MSIEHFKFLEKTFDCVCGRVPFPEKAYGRFFRIHAVSRFSRRLLIMETGKSRRERNVVNMKPSDFQAAVERHKADMMQMAARSGQPENTVGTPVELPADEDAIINQPEAGTGRDPLQTLTPEANTFAAFQKLNPKVGFLRVQAFAGQRTIPVPNATVLVTRDFTDGARRFASGVTNESGVLDGIALPAPDSMLAQSPTGEMPYALYDIRVSHPDYRTEIYRQVPIFAGIKSIQPVQFQSDHTGA